MADDRCDVEACPEAPKFYAPGKRRCLAHVAWDAPELRSDAPRSLPIGEPERRVWRVRVAVALILQVEAERVAAHERASADAAHGALEAVVRRQCDAERILEEYGALSSDAALRVLRGEPLVRERS